MQDVQKDAYQSDVIKCIITTKQTYTNIIYRKEWHSHLM